MAECTISWRIETLRKGVLPCDSGVKCCYCCLSVVVLCWLSRRLGHASLCRIEPSGHSWLEEVLDLLEAGLGFNVDWSTGLA